MDLVRVLVWCSRGITSRVVATVVELAHLVSLALAIALVVLTGVVRVVVGIVLMSVVTTLMLLMVIVAGGVVVPLLVVISVIIVVTSFSTMARWRDCWLSFVGVVDCSCSCSSCTSSCSKLARRT